MSIDQWEQDLEYEFDQDLPQLHQNGAVDLSLPKPIYNTPPKDTFTKASAIIDTFRSQGSTVTSKSQSTQTPLPYQHSIPTPLSTIVYSSQQSQDLKRKYSNSNGPTPQREGANKPEYYYSDSD